MSFKTGSKQNRRRRGSFLFGVINAILTLVVLAMLVIGGLVAFGAQRFYADGPKSEQSSFVVERGASLAGVAQKLENAGLIADRLTFQLAAMVQRKQSAIRAGEYNISPNASMADILKEITQGRPISYSLTIPEGFTSWQVVEKINATPNLIGKIVDIPPEGSLLPDTYSFERGDERQKLLDQMSAAMSSQLAQIWAGRAPDLPISSPGELVTLASIVEKETGVADERPMVAGVFINRLNRGMRLQSDPTIIYGITEGKATLSRGLRRSEIDAKTPYNTYQIDGLPVGPIANPGIDALQAVARPAKTDALYFVADGSGGHAFANSYAEHQRNVAAWRKVEREQAKAAQLQAQKDAQTASEAKSGQ
ncbi:FIG004453: protein YceG like [hydrothermal vent metagenome]|uniref:FIG004453: protein YceG like n=1 Tax=hydrothermal vent metagenome TaxID=652676 RepID=A0A3B0TD83_9ZZZZ